MYFKYNPILIALILVGLLATIGIGLERHAVEQNNQQVELVFDYDEIVELAQLDGSSVTQTLAAFKDAGITSLAIGETTLETLSKTEAISVVPGAQLINEHRAGFFVGDYLESLIKSNTITADTVYVIGHNPTTFNEVKSDLMRRLVPNQIVDLSDNTHQILAVKTNFDKLMKRNLGLSSESMKLASDSGFWVIARPTNYPNVQSDDINAVFARIEGIHNISALMFVSEESLGYPNLLELTANELKEHQLTLAMIEHPSQIQFYDQKGLLELAKDVQYQAARVYVIPKDEQPKITMQDAVQRWVLADQDRNIRINLLRKYDKPDVGSTLLETNLTYIRTVKQALEHSNFTIGKASTYQPYFPNLFLLAIVILGATATGILFLTLVHPFPSRYQYLFLVLLSSILLVGLFRGHDTLIRQAVATVSATLFPVLAMTWQLDYWRKTIVPGSLRFSRMVLLNLIGLCITVGISLIGGLYVAGLLGDVRFLLEMELFRGVKIIFTAPLLLITVIYLTRFGISGNKSTPHLLHQLKLLLHYPVYLKTLLIIGVTIVVAWVYIGRTGNTSSVPAPAFELKLRHLLETLFYARPRTREFLIGHPAFVLIPMAISRQWPKLLHYILVVVATIGQLSVVETFAHIRTPICTSLVRGLCGLSLGALCGLCLLIAVQVFHYLLLTRKRKVLET